MTLTSLAVYVSGCARFGAYKGFRRLGIALFLWPTRKQINKNVPLPRCIRVFVGCAKAIYDTCTEVVLRTCILYNFALHGFYYITLSSFCTNSCALSRGLSPRAVAKHALFLFVDIARDFSEQMMFSIFPNMPSTQNILIFYNPSAQTT